MRHLKRNEACLISGSSYVAEYSILSPFLFLFAPPWLSQITLQEIAEDVISREMEWQPQSKGKAIMWEQKMHHDKKSNTQVLWSIFLCVSHVHVMLGKDSYIYKKKKKNGCRIFSHCLPANTHASAAPVRHVSLFKMRLCPILYMCDVCPTVTVRVIFSMWLFTKHDSGDTWRDFYISVIFPFITSLLVLITLLLS